MASEDDFGEEREKQFVTAKRRMEEYEGRRNKEFLNSDNENISYLKGLLKEREQITDSRIKELEKIKNNNLDLNAYSNFFLKNITGY